MIVLDFETYYDQEYSLSKLTTDEYVTDPRFEIVGVGLYYPDADGGVTSSEWLSQAEFREVCSKLAGATILCHHAQFDGHILNHHYGITPALWLDTLSMARKYGFEANSLDALSKRYNVGKKGREVVAAKGKRFADFTREEWSAYGGYCVNDCILAYKIYKKLASHTLPHELTSIDTTIRMFTEPTLMLHGDKLSIYLAEERARKVKALAGCGADKTVLMSNNKLAAKLKELNVAPPTKISKRTKKEAWAFGKTDAMFTALQDHDNPAVRAIVSARLGVKSTIEETRTERLLAVAQSHRPAPVYLKYYGAHTGRWSGGDRSNWQNLKRGGVLRDSVCAPTGHKVVVADSAQIEARVLAWLAGEDQLIDGFRGGRDVYCDFGTEAFRRPITAADTIERFISKTCVLALGYQAGWYRLANTLLEARVTLTRENMLALGCNGSEFLHSTKKMEMFKDFPSAMDRQLLLYHCAVADALVRKYRSKYASISSLWSLCDSFLPNMISGIERAVVKRGDEDVVITGKDSLRLPAGKTLLYPDLRSTKDGYICVRGREVVNLYGGKIVENITQALAHSIIAEQMNVISERYKIVLTAHDEIVCVVQESRAEECKAYMEGVMSTAPNWATGLPLAAKGGIGDTYGQAK